jgi:glycosyltransferase involved in cell wall biosynthesis
VASTENRPCHHGQAPPEMCPGGAATPGEETHSSLEFAPPRSTNVGGFDRVVFVGGVIPDELRDEVARLTRHSLVASADILQRSMIKGFAALSQAPIIVINSMYVGTFPRSYRRVRIGSASLTIHDESDVRLENTGYINLPILNVFSRARGLSRAYGRTADDGHPQELLFVYSMLDFNLLFLSRLGNRRPGRTVCLMVTDLPENMVLYGRNSDRFRRVYHKLRRNMMRRLTARGLRRVDAFVMLTPQMRSRIPCEGKRVYEMEGMLDTQKYDRVRARHTPANDSLTRITYTGGLEVELGVLDLLEAFEQVGDSNARLIICGDGSLREVVTGHALADRRIVFEGVVTHERSIAVQLDADVLVCPTRVDGEISKLSFPAKLLEYVYSGNPVVCRRLEGIPREYDHYLFYCDDESCSALAMAIQDALGSRDSSGGLACSRQRDFVSNYKSVEARIQGLLHTLCEEE